MPLPNRSGFVTAAQITDKYKPQGLTVTTLKKALADEYPAYVRTFYPYSQAKHNISRWQDDPNNEENADFHGLPWPPYRGTQDVKALDGDVNGAAAALGSGAASEPAPRSDGTAKAKRTSGAKKPARDSQDATYRPAEADGDQSTDSELELELERQRRREQAATSTPSSHKRKRSTTYEPYRPPKVDSEDSQTEFSDAAGTGAGVRKRARTTPSKMPVAIPEVAEKEQSAKTPGKRGRPGRAASGSTQK